MTKFPLVVVRWLDSRRPAAAWLRLSDFEPDGVCDCLSVGYIIYEDETQLTIAPNIADADSEDPQISGTIEIPVCAVVEKKILKI